MAELTGKQKRALRGRGQTLEASVQLGKSGPTEAIVGLIEEQLIDNELIKVRLGGMETGRERKHMAVALAEMTHSECVGVTGRSVLLYRSAETAE